MMTSCAWYNYVCWGCLGSALCTSGVLSSGLAFYALRSSSSRTSRSTCTILRCLAAVDAVLLLSVLVTDCVPYICEYTRTCLSPWHTWPYVRYAWTATPTSHLAGVWLVALIAANRFTAVCRPHELHSAWGVRRTRRAVGVVIAGALLYNVPRLFEYRISTRVNPCNNRTELAERLNEFGKNWWYRVGYKAALTSAVLIAAPLLVQGALTVAVIRRLTSGSSASSTVSSKRNRRRVGGMTRMLMAVVGVAICCQLPLGVYQLIRVMLPDTDDTRRSCDTALYWLDTVSKLAVNANPSLNFIVYCTMSPPFRASLRALWCLDGSASYSSGIRHIAVVTPPRLEGRGEGKSSPKHSPEEDSGSSFCFSRSI